MQPLIDADVLVYELASCGEYEEQDEETGEPIKHIRDFEFVRELTEERIRGICLDVEATSPPILFFTGSGYRLSLLNRDRVANGQEPIQLSPSIRMDVATVKPYKGTRVEQKPYHFNNLTAYLFANYDHRVSNGLEADDLLAIEQSGRNDTIICTRDKDLRMVPGWHFGWECGAQPSFGPELVDARGWLRIDDKGKVRGVGLKFFFYQMLVGDTVDNIPGCPKIGEKTAFKLLSEVNNKKECEQIIKEQYQKVYGDNYMERLEEQSQLLWMAREVDDTGYPVGYQWK